MIRRPPRSTRTDTLFPTRRSSDLPEFAGLTLGVVKRIKLKSSLGIPACADVVLPTDYQPGRHYPLIVVQYQSRGFLRGGTGDEFPVQLFANHGRSEEHTSELQSLMRISYAVFCLKKQKKTTQ